ncbi:MAG TPA: DNA methyltransferase [Herpetosiphonaceae bacterium]|nr:DNA methyltransferase [Herpetosiphonaceae bacterium]
MPHSAQPPATPDDQRPLTREDLLATLESWRDTPSMPLLRDRIAGLREAIDRPGAGERLAGLDIDPAYLDAELAQIAAAQTLERAFYYLGRLDKALTTVRTSPINDINLNRWKEYDDIVTDSLWVESRRDRSGGHTAGYWGNFIPQIPNQMMRRYTKRGEWVIDTFAGSGTTLLEGRRLGRHTLGVELQPAVAAAATERIEAAANPHRVTSAIHVGDSRAADWPALLERHGARSAQLALLHPPYFDIIKFSQDERDLSNAASMDAFLAMLHDVAANAARALDPGRYLALVIGDKYVRGEWLPLGFRAMESIQQAGFMLKSIVVKNFEDTTGKRSQKELWRYRALVGGFYIFKHEYIFVLQKRA